MNIFYLFNFFLLFSFKIHFFLYIKLNKKPNSCLSNLILSKLLPGGKNWKAAFCFGSNFVYEFEVKFYAEEDFEHCGRKVIFLNWKTPSCNDRIKTIFCLSLIDKCKIYEIFLFSGTYEFLFEIEFSHTIFALCLKIMFFFK